MIGCLSIGSTLAQDNFTFIYPNNNDDIGFGVYQECNKHISYIVNGPLFGNDNQPVGGYVVVEQFYDAKNKQYHKVGRQVKDWVNPKRFNGNFKEDNGVFGLTKSGVMVLQRYEDWILNSKDLLWGFQNGMILVLESKNLHSKSNRSKYVRSGIGYRDDGSLVVAISKHPINLYELGDALRARMYECYLPWWFYVCSWILHSSIICGIRSTSNQVTILSLINRRARCHNKSQRHGQKKYDTIT